MKLTWLPAIAGAAAMLLLTAVPDLSGLATGAQAMGSSSSSSSSGTSTVKKKKKPAKKCVKRNSAGKCIKRAALDDNQIYDRAYALAKNEQRYDEALALLRTAADQKDVRILTFIGYTTRKLGDVDQGLVFYQQALTIDPNYVEAREYMGEAYLQKGDLASAQGQLAEIASRCGVTCEPYEELAKQIGEFQAKLGNG